MPQTGQSPEPTLSLSTLELWLSPARFNRYTEVVPNNDVQTAVELYRWNSRLASATFQECCHVEVALRNAYDRELSTRHPNWTIDTSSTLFVRSASQAPATVRDQEILNGRSRSDLAYATSGLGQNPTHGQVVADLMFGFWKQLTHRARTDPIWTPMLSRCYPRGTSRGSAHRLVDSVNKFRNRLAHSEPTFTRGTGFRHRRAETFQLLTMLQPQVASWLRSTSEVDTILAECPHPPLVSSMK